MSQRKKEHVSNYNPVGWHSIRLYGNKGKKARLFHRGHLIGYQFSGLTMKGKNLVPPCIMQGIIKGQRIMWKACSITGNDDRVGWHHPVPARWKWRLSARGWVDSSWSSDTMLNEWSEMAAFFSPSKSDSLESVDAYGILQMTLDGYTELRCDYLKGTAKPSSCQRTSSQPQPASLL